MIDISVFKGEIPIVSSRLLPDGNASSAINCELINGNLEPIRGNLKVADAQATTQTIWKMSEEWLEWGVPSVKIINDIVYNSSGRIFFCGDGYPKEADAVTSLSGSPPFPTVTRRLGIPPATSALSYSITVAGTGAPKEVSYCYERVGQRYDNTVVRSAPAPATVTTTAKTDSQIKLTGFTDATEAGVYTTHYWIYRLEVGDNGEEFRFIAAIDKTAIPLEYTDILSQQSYETLPDAIWSAPVDDIQGLIIGSNGMVFGFNDNILYVSETFIPYTFPAEFSLSMPSEIVGLGFARTFIIVFTKTNPVLVYGDTPDRLSQEIISVELPCKSAQSIVSVQGGVIFASALGLYLIDSGGNIINLTQNIFSPEQWSALPISSAFAFYYNGSYLCFFKGTDTAIEFKVGRNEIRRFNTSAYVWGGRYVSTVSNILVEFTSADYDEFITADGYKMYFIGADNPITHDTLYLIQTSDAAREIVAWCVGEYVDYIWESKEVSVLRKHVLTAGRVTGDFTLGGVKIELKDETGAIFFTKTITAESVFRIPAKQISTLKVRLTGKAKIKRVLFGASLSEVIEGA